jgi:transcriptional regulator with XRE-family HTH domain
MKLNELKAEIVRNGMTIEEFADKVGIERTTLWRRFNNSGNFTLTEITKIADVLNLTKQRIIEIFFSEEKEVI